MSSPESRNKQFENVLRELHKTEDDYAKYLMVYGLHVNDLQKQVNKTGNVFDRSFSKKFNAHMIALMPIHRQLTDKFEYLIQNKDKDCSHVYDEINNLMNESLKHTQYISKHYNKMLSISGKAFKHKTRETMNVFKNIKTTAQSLNVQSPNDFSTLFIKPIQRFPRYELLSRELVKYGDKEHAIHDITVKLYNDSRTLCVALNDVNQSKSIVKQVTDYINGGVRKRNTAKSQLKQNNLKTLDAKFKEVGTIKTMIINADGAQLLAMETRLKNLHQDFKSIEKSNRNSSHTVGNSAYVGQIETLRLLSMYERTKTERGSSIKAEPSHDKGVENRGKLKR